MLDVMASATSISSISSQERQNTVTSPNMSYCAEGPDAGQLAPTLVELHWQSSTGLKRMANGEIKVTQRSMPTSPVATGTYGHSRNSSTMSKFSQISDVNENPCASGISRV